MPDPGDIVPLLRETIDSIRARLDADANAGIDPTDAAFIDTTVGGFYWDLTQAPALEIERLWDFLSNEVVSAMFPSLAWGDYLDAWGETIDLPRKDETAATGQATFTGTDGAAIPIGTTISTAPADPDLVPVEFVTTAAATISSGTAVVDIAAAEPGIEGNTAAGTISEIVTDVADVDTVTNATATSGGADVENDERYKERILLSLAEPQGGGTVADYKRWALEDPSVGAVTVEAVWSGPGTVRVIVVDTQNNPVQQQVIDRLRLRMDPANGTTLLNGATSVGATSITVDSTTTGFRAASGGIPQLAEVEGDIFQYTGKTGTTFTGIPGSGAFSLESTHADNATVLQSGAGGGEVGSIGHQVTIITPSTVTINVAARVTPEAGYTLDGALGTVALTAAINAALAEYISGLKPGEDVIQSKVESMFFTVSGVADVNAVVLSSSPSISPDSDGNIVLGGNQVAEFGTATLT